MTTPGFFELYPSARPALPAGAYTATSDQRLQSAPPHGEDGAIPVDDTAFHLHIDAPRYVLPPDQILSTFPPAGAQGDWRERLPQIVLKRRTLPWERNPDPAVAPATAPPWLALVVLADGEAQFSSDVDVAGCVTPGVALGPDADVPKGRYVEVGEDVVHAVFPCRDELDLLCHVRKVDLRDTELALGDDDGFLAVVLSSRLPQPGPPNAPGGEPLPVTYTAALVNLEHQLDSLLPTEPQPQRTFDATRVDVLVDVALLTPAPDLTVDEIAMTLGPALLQGGKAVREGSASAQVVPFGTAQGQQVASAAWATGPSTPVAITSGDRGVAIGVRTGIVDANLGILRRTLRFPVLASWEFTCTGSGGFERLMNDLDVGLLGTLGADDDPPVPEVAATGHVALDHLTRRGEPARAWYRGPFTPQPTRRSEPVAGELPLAHTGDQLRKVVPDGREDLSLAAMFEIGRLLTLSKPALVAALMAWRRELFGAARARELAELLAGSVLTAGGIGIIGGRASLEDLIRTQLVGSFLTTGTDRIAPMAPEVTRSRIPRDLADLTPDVVALGLGADPDLLRKAGGRFGVDGLATLPLRVDEVTTKPVSSDPGAVGRLQDAVDRRLDLLVADTIREAQGPGRDVPGTPGPAGPITGPRGPIVDPGGPIRPDLSRGPRVPIVTRPDAPGRPTTADPVAVTLAPDDLDLLITAATEVRD